ncbi:hypothetical protein FHX37_2820 [Haloactinospora alba]|uniref:TPR repeat protein n=1 Tax=Haloactinospora alba TaxID=405555 RepID=A0A543NLW8_9ACTN|nr:tetratricopeptide repeat protein [Haloactinospora alba]TQN32835.1 hypothetical protein FHX37_2820 [Haloactinospora alba]
MAQPSAGDGGTHNATGDVHGVVVQARDVYGDVTVRSRAPAWSPPPRDSWPRITETDPHLLGVHRARPGTEESETLPPYVPRDMDADLHRRTHHARDNGGFVLITGDSTAGKTRTALEALRAELPTWPVLVPPRGAELGTLPSEGGYVLWLDDAEAHLGSQGLEPTLVDRLTRTGVVVMATMRQQFYDTLKNTPTSAHEGHHDRLERDIGMRVLTMTEPVVLERVWSPAELDRAEGFEDARLAEAHIHHGIYGIAEYLAAGPQLRTEWTSAYRPTAQGGHPRGHALVAAAVDLARAGLTTPLPGHVLEGLHTRYLTRAAPLRPEPLADAWQWATRQRHGVTSLLLPGDLEETTWRPFDYLTEHPHTEGLPQQVWDVALEHAPSDGELFHVGIAAHEFGRADVSESVWRPLVEVGYTDAMFNLGVLLANQGCPEEAEHHYTTAARTGHADAMNNLGNLLKGQGRPEEAEDWYTAAAAADDTNAMVNLGTLLHSQGRRGEAERWWATAARAGRADAMFNLGGLLADQGRLDEAEGHYTTAAVRAGHADAMYNLGVLLEGQQRLDEAEHHYTTAAHAGHTGAMNNLGTLLKERGRLEEAQHYYTTAARAGENAAMYNLGVLFDSRGHVEEMEYWYAAAARAGHTSAAFNLGVLLEDQQRLDEADHYTTAAHAGHTGAMYNLGLLLKNRQRPSEAEHWWKLAATTAGHLGAVNNLGVLLHGQERVAEARKWWRLAAEHGHERAKRWLAETRREQDEG